MNQATTFSQSVFVEDERKCPTEQEVMMAMGL
jgi:hypothetical protein